MKTSNFYVVQRAFPLAQESDWHQHPYGGGWCHNTATVPASVELPADSVVGPGVVVAEGARIGRNVCIESW